MGAFGKLLITFIDLYIILYFKMFYYLISEFIINYIKINNRIKL
jgi:hypothetical protein